MLSCPDAKENYQRGARYMAQHNTGNLSIQLWPELGLQLVKGEISSLLIHNDIFHHQPSIETTIVEPVCAAGFEYWGLERQNSLILEHRVEFEHKLSLAALFTRPSESVYSKK